MDIVRYKTVREVKARQSATDKISKIGLICPALSVINRNWPRKQTLLSNSKVCAELKFTFKPFYKYFNSIFFLLRFLYMLFVSVWCVESKISSNESLPFSPSLSSLFMMQNESVRNKLKTHLNVQLTDSRVVEGPQQQLSIRQRFSLYNQKNAMNFNNDRHDDQLSDISLINQLRVLDDRSLSNYGWEDPLKKSDQRYIDQELRRKKSDRQKESQSRRQKMSVKRLNNEYSLKKKCERSIERKQNYGNFQSHLETIGGINHREIKEIEQKISNLPFELQQKIKSSLHSKSKEKPYTGTDHRIDIFSAQNPHTKSNNDILSKLRSKIQELKAESEEQELFLNSLSQQHDFSIKSSIRKTSSDNKRLDGLRKTSSNKRIQVEGSVQKKLNRHQTNLHIFGSSPYKNQQQLSESKEGRFGPNQSRGSPSKQELSKEDQIMEQVQRRRRQFKEQKKQQRQKQLSPDRKRQQPQQPIRINYERNDQTELLQRFNHSKVIGNYTELLKKAGKCPQCRDNFGAVALDQEKQKQTIFVCNKCDIKAGLERSVSYSSSIENATKAVTLQSSDLQCKNHPIIAVLFQIENKRINEHSLKVYNELLLNIKAELENLQRQRNILQALEGKIVLIKNKFRLSSKQVIESKTLIHNSFDEATQNQSQNLLSPTVDLKSLIPPEFVQQLDAWAAIRQNQYCSWPQIQKTIEFLSPLYLKRSFSTMSEFLRPLLYNFQETAIKISVSEGIKLPVNNLGHATFLVDGTYNIMTQFQKIQRLKIEFTNNKRTFREIASTMDNLPSHINSLEIKYNHRVHSHISAEKYPLFTRLCSIRKCKNLSIEIEQCKDEDDLINALKNITKKYSLKLTVSRNMYVRGMFPDGTACVLEMLRKVGKSIVSIELELPLMVDMAAIYKELLTGERTKLIHFSAKFPEEQSEDYEFRSSLKVKRLESLPSDNILSQIQGLDFHQEEASDSQPECHDFSQPKSKESFYKQSFHSKLTKKVQALALFRNCPKQNSQQNQSVGLKCSRSSYEKEESRVRSEYRLRLDVLGILM